MHHFSEFIAFLVTLAVAEGLRHETRSITGEDVVLRCLAESKPGVQYRSVTWYKVAEEPSQSLTGLLRKKLTEDNQVQKYEGVEREIMLLSSKGLLLSNITTEDSGIYKCFLSAPLGHQNQEGETVLKVYEASAVEQVEVNSSEIYLAETAAAMTVLIVALLMFFISYVCVRNVSQSNKKKVSLLKMPSHGKDLIVTSHLACKNLPEVCV